ncbi:MAG TPA: hypothetical protein VGG89_05995 [Candidatus Baltobacteraceae bacterium]
MIFTVYYVAALVLLVAEARGLLRSRRPATPRFPGIAWVAVLVLAYAAQIGVCEAMASRGSWPIGVVRWQADATGAVALLLLLALAQSYALLALYRTGAKTAAVAAGAVLMALFSFAPVLANADVYAYVGNGVLGRAAYAPPAVPFAGDLAAINAFWHVPVPAATYGPLWIAVARALTELAPTLLLKITAFRVLGAALLAALFALLRAYGIAPRVLAIVALNPALYFEFVLNAHNDLLPVVIVTLAALTAPWWPLGASLLIAAAALIKVPFVLLGLPVLARVREPLARALGVAVALVVAAVVSWLGGGEAYARALLAYASGSHLETFVHAIAALAAFALLIFAVAAARGLRTSVWLLPMFGAYTAPWYALWSLPYALGAQRILVYLAIWLPFVTFLTEPALTRVWTIAGLLPAVVILALGLSPRRQSPHGGPS